MRAGGKRALLPAAGIAALILAGCGGSSSSSDSTGAAAQTGASGTRPTTTAPASTAAQAQAEAEVQQTKPELGSPSEVPQAKGGDNSIQGFGSEAGQAERIAAARVLSAYLEAYAKGDARTACALLSSGVNQFLAQGITPGGSGPKGCEPTLARLTAGIAGQAKELSEIRLLSLRVDGDRAFAIYEDAAKRILAQAMAREGGAWKVAAVAGTPLQ